MSDLKIIKNDTEHLIRKSDDMIAGPSGGVYITDGALKLDLPLRSSVSISTGTEVDEIVISPHHACRTISVEIGGRYINLIVEDDENTVTVWENDKQLLTLSD